MILYLDTSALVKRYFQEPYSDDVLSKWESATQIVTSAVAYAETMATIHRKKREENLNDALIMKNFEYVSTGLGKFHPSKSQRAAR